MATGKKKTFMKYLTIVLNKAYQSKETQQWLEPYLANTKTSENVVVLEYCTDYTSLIEITLYNLIMKEIADPLRMQEVLCDHFDYDPKSAFAFSQTYGKIFTLTIPNACSMIYVRPLSVNQCEIKIL